MLEAAVWIWTSMMGTWQLGVLATADEMSNNR